MVWALPGPLRDLIRPGAAFRGPAPGLGRAFGRMAALWMPLAFAQAMLGARQVLQAYGRLRVEDPPAWLIRAMDVDPGAWRQLAAALPPPPPFGRVWPWLVVAVPLGVAGTWLHHAVWDHTGLWLLRGARREGGFRVTLAAEAEALRITSLGILPALLGWVPVLGWLLALPLMLLEAYLWLYRGFSLAARHGCEPWRGLAATVIHAALLGLAALLLALLVLAALPGAGA